jgi:hypothetical protein
MSIFSYFEQLIYRLGAHVPSAKSHPTSETKAETHETHHADNEKTSSPKSQEETSKVESEPESELGK